MRMPQIQPRVAKALVLALAVVSLGTLLPDGASAARSRRFTVTNKNCYYAGQLYSWNACRGGQRCARALNDEYYWEDDTECPKGAGGQTQGGFGQV